MRWKIVFAVVLASFGAYASDGVWTNAVGGVWTNADNWTDGTLADGVGAAADFATLRLLRNLEVRDPAARTLGRLVFDDWGGAFSWSVNGWDASGNATGEPLTLSWPSARPEIIVSNTTVYLSKQVAGTEGLLKTGPGALYVLTNAAYSGLTEVREGLLTFDSTGAKVVARYTFEDPSNLGRDSSGNGNDLDIYGTGSIVYDASGYHGGGALFDGDAYLYRAALQDFPSGNESFTMAVWLRPTSTEKKSIMGWGDFSVRHGCTGLQIESPGSSVTHYIYDGTYNLTVSAGGLQSGWTHLAVTYDSDTKTRSMYVNGTLKGTTALVTLIVPPQDFMIGRALNDLRFVGKMDEVTVVKGVLTEEQIGDLMTDVMPSAAADSVLSYVEAAQVDTFGTLGLSRSSLLGALSGDGRVALGNGVRLTLVPAADTNFDGSISGNGSVCLAAAENTSMTLNGLQGYSGATIVSNGTLEVAGERKYDVFLANEIVAYYDFDDAEALGRDRSSNGNDLSPYASSSGPLGWSSDGKFGGALWVMNDNWLVHPTGVLAGLVSGDMPFTVAAWVNFASDAPNRSGFFFWTGSVGNMSVRLHDAHTTYVTGTTGSMLIVTNLPDQVSGEPPEGWHHVAVMYTPEGSITELYVDGESVGSKTQVHKIGSGIFRIGASQDVLPSYLFRGLLDDFVVLNSAVPANIPFLMKGVRAVTPLHRLPQLAAHYRFDNPGEIGKDSSGLGNDLEEAVATNGPLSWTSSGKFGGALSITNWNWLTRSAFPCGVPSGDQPVTVSYWINADASCSSLAMHFYWGGLDSASFRVQFAGSFSSLAAGPFGNALMATIPSSIQTGEPPLGWHHIASVYDPADGKYQETLYLDGTLVGMRTGVKRTATPTNFHIGSGNDDTEGRAFRGLIDEVAILGYAATPAEIPFLMDNSVFEETGRLSAASPLAIETDGKLVLRDGVQSVPSLTGSGELFLDDAELAVTGETNCTFLGTVTGKGSLVAQSSCTLSLAGTDASFVGELRVTNAMLSVIGTTGPGTTVSVQPGGLFGGTGTLSGFAVVEAGGALQSRFGEANLTFAGGLTLAAGAGFRFSAEAAGVGNLVTTGTLTLPESGFVEISLPTGATGSFVLLRAEALAGNSALSDWRVTVDPELSSGTTARLRADGNAIVLSVWRQSTAIFVY